MADEKPFSRNAHDRELARRFAAVYISEQMGISVTTGYKNLKDRDVGDIWYWLASVAHDTVPNYMHAKFKRSKPGPRLVQ